MIQTRSALGLANSSWVPRTAAKRLGVRCVAVSCLLWVVFGVFMGFGIGFAKEARTGRTQETVKVSILATSDLHGEVDGTDHLGNRPSTRGLALLAPMIASLTRAQPNRLLIDVGDTLAGSPVTYVAQKRLATMPNPMIAAMNHLGYSAMVVGNHDFDFGWQHFEMARLQSGFPWVSANIIGTKGPLFSPWIIRNVGGVRVGIVGATTPGVPHWNDPAAYRQASFVDPLLALWAAVADVRARGVDLVVVAAHLGMGVHPETGELANFPPYEGSIGERIPAAIPGVDGIVLGHTHAAVASTVAGIPVVQPRANGTHLACLDFDLERLAGGRWRVVGRSGRVLAVPEGATPDPTILALADPYRQATEDWLRTPIGTTPVALSAWGAAFADNSLTELALSAMLEATGADVALTALPLGAVSIATGTITVRDLHRLVIFDNTLVTATVTGAQLRQILEHSTRFFGPWDDQDNLGDLISGDVFYFNCDVAAGVEQTIDLRRPVGQRVVSMRRKGREIGADERLRVVVANFRFNGGGDYPAWADATEVVRTGIVLREAMIAKVRRDGTIAAKAPKRRTFLPPAIERLPSRKPAGRD